VTVDVILPLPLNKPYSYAVPTEYQQHVQAGCRVIVELRNRRLTGIIASVTNKDPASLKPIIDVLDTTPALSQELLRLTHWIAHYYICGWGEAVRAALPSGIDELEKTYIRSGQHPPDTWLHHPVAGALFRYLQEHPEATPRGLRQVGINVSMPLLRTLQREGCVELEVRWEKPKVQIRYAQHVHLVSTIRVTEAASRVRGHKQKAVLYTLSALQKEGIQEPRLSNVLERAKASPATVRSLAARGFLEITKKEINRTPDYGPSQKKSGPIILNRGQEQCLQAINTALEAREYKTLLLHGVTGSGKTEVYIRALSKVLERGQTGIVLVPEIALTPQTVRRFQQRFGNKVAVLHSRMSLGERYDAWRHLRSGRYSVAIGPRSVILAPLTNIGIIIVDEEHESSYKQHDPAPRYHARDVAVVRARMNNAVCVLGSATPSLESLQNTRTGKYTLLEMKERIPVAGLTAAPLPDIKIIDLTIEHKKRRLQGALSLPLRQIIEERIARREQIILLQNRRGYAPVIECKACGFVPTCSDCAVSMTLHKPYQRLRCHYCGNAHPMIRVCPKCKSTALSELGTGTQRVEEELRFVFPQASVVRMDQDTTQQKNAHHAILDKFGRGAADILLGTQMVAKGLDFERVTLVGVISADVGMQLPDYRAEERIFQLLLQVAGRAGRAELKGDVILQTRQPEHPVFRHVIEHDYRGFTEVLLEERNMLQYPPFGKIVGVGFKGPDERRVQEIAHQWYEILRTLSPTTLQILGPGPAFIARIKRQYRYHLLLKIPKQFSGVQQLLRAAIQQYGGTPRGYRVSIDVDAVGLF